MTYDNLLIEAERDGLIIKENLLNYGLRGCVKIKK